MGDRITYIELDVHKDAIVVAVTEGGRRGEVREYGRIANAPAALQRLAGNRRKRALTFVQAGKRAQNCKEMPQSQADYSRQREVFPACDEGAGRLLRAWRGKIPPHSLFYKRRSTAPIRLPPRNPDARLIKLLIRAHRFNSTLIGKAGVSLRHWPGRKA